VIKKLLNNVISDVEFLWRDLKMKNIASIMEPENIYYLKEKEAFFLGNWDKITQENTARPQDLTSTIIGSIELGLQSQNIAAEIKALALALLRMKKIDIEQIELLLSSKKVRASVYEAVVKAMVVEGFNDSLKLQNLLERMLSLEPKNLPNLEEFKIKEDKNSAEIEKAKNEANAVRKEVGIQVVLEESKINPSSNSVVISSPLISTPPTLLAWCSHVNNKISVIDLEAKQNYVTFDGARISDKGKYEIF
jgi:ribonuclease HI